MGLHVKTLRYRHGSQSLRIWTQKEHFGMKLTDTTTNLNTNRIYLTISVKLCIMNGKWCHRFEYNIDLMDLCSFCHVWCSQYGIYLTSLDIHTGYQMELGFLVFFQYPVWHSWLSKQNRFVKCVWRTKNNSWKTLFSFIKDYV